MTCPMLSPCSVSGRSNPPKLIMPASTPLAKRNMRSRSLRMYQNSVRLMRRWGMVVESGYRSKGASQTRLLYNTPVHLRSLTRHVLDFCFPGACAVCNAPCEGDVPLCEKCRIDLAALEFAASCDKCAKPLKEHASPCPYCKGAGVPHF